MTDRLTIVYCSRCNWRSEELTREKLRDLGTPLACQGEHCGNYGAKWVTFLPSEREEAHRIAGMMS